MAGGYAGTFWRSLVSQSHWSNYLKPSALISLSVRARAL